MSQQQQKQHLQEISPCQQQCTSPSSGHFINQHAVIIDKERNDSSLDEGNQLDNDYNFDSEIQFYEQQQWRDEDIENESVCPPNEWGNEGYILSSRYQQETKKQMLQDEQKVISDPPKNQLEMRNIHAVPVWQKQVPMSRNLNKAKVHQVLYSSDLMDDEEEAICARCQVQNNFFFEAAQIERRLYSKYASSQNYYYSRDVNDILMGGRTQAVTDFKDSAVMDEQAEYLKRFYSANELENKTNLLTEYYKFHKDIPRLFMLPETIVLDNYHYKKRRFEDKKIAMMIEEENNKLNPNLNQDSDNHNKCAQEIKVEEEEMKEELFLEEISSFINRDEKKSRNIHENIIKKTKNEITLLEELNCKLEEIVNSSSRSYSLAGSRISGRGGTGEDEGLKPFDNAQLDHFLSFLNQQNNQTVLAAVQQKPLPQTDTTSRNYSSSQQMSLETALNQQQIQNKNDKMHVNNNDNSKQSQKLQVSQNNQETKQTPSVQGDQMKKKNPPQLILEDIACHAEPALKNQNILELGGVPYGLSAFSAKQSTHKFSLGIQQNLLSVRSAREQYQISQNNHFQPINQLTSSLSVKTGAKGGNSENIKIKDISSQPTSVQSQQIVSSNQASKCYNAQNQSSAVQQQQNTNSVSSSSLVVKLDTKESQLYTPRSPAIPMSSQHSILSKNLLKAVKPQQNVITIPTAKPPISPRESLLPSPKQSSIQNTQLHQNYFSSKNSQGKLEKNSNHFKNNQQSKHPPICQIPLHSHGNDRNYLAAMALSKSGWRQLNLKLKLDHLNSSKEKPTEKNKSTSNNPANEALLKNTINSSNIGVANAKDPLSQRSCSSKNLDQLTPKYNFYEMFKEQIANHQSSPINWMTTKTVAKNVVGATTQPSSTALNMWQLISAQQQQALQKTSSQQINLSSLKQQSEALNKPAAASQAPQGQAKKQTSTAVSSSQHQKTFSQPKCTVSSVSSNQKQMQQQQIQQQSQQQPYLLSTEMKVNSVLSPQKRDQTGIAVLAGNSIVIPKQNPLEQQIKIINQQHTSQNDSKVLSRSQTKQILEKQSSSSVATDKVIKSYDQSHNPGNPIVSSSPVAISFSSKQPSRNSSLETNGNSNIPSKKTTTQLFPNSKREIKSVYNHVQQLASDGLPGKQSISARDYQQNAIISQASQFEVTDSQQNSLRLLGNTFSLTATANSGSMALYGYHQSKVSQQSSEYDNRDSAPSTTGGGKSNNTSTQQHSSSGANSTQNFKNQATNGSTFSTVSASTQNNNNNTINASANNIQIPVFSQNHMKTAAQPSKISSQSTIPYSQQSQQHQAIQQVTKEGLPPAQASKKNTINHKHTKSENSVNLLENTHGFIGLNNQYTIPSTSPTFSSFSVNGNINAQKLQSNQLPQQPQQQEQYIQKLLSLSSKKNSLADPGGFSSLTVPSSCRNQSSAVIHTQPLSPRLIPNPLALLQGKTSERQISVNQLPQYLSKKQSTASPSTGKQTKGISKSNSQLQVQIIPNHSFQTTIPSAAMSPLSAYGSQDRFSISGVHKNPQITNQTSGNQILASQFKQLNAGSSNSSNSNNASNLSSQALLKIQFEGAKKSKKKSMY